MPTETKKLKLTKAQSELIESLKAQAEAAEPKFMPPGTLATPGMPCTKVTGSDSYAATVTAVSSSGRRITVAEKKGHPYQATLRKDGYYHRVGDPAQAWNTIMLGLAEDHRDPHR